LNHDYCGEDHLNLSILVRQLFRSASLVFKYNPGVSNTFARINVLRREGNRCDAVLSCDACRADLPFDFYDPPGLDPAWLSQGHYAACAPAHGVTAVEIRLKLENGTIKRLLFIPKTRELSVLPQKT
jgi:hypothetical protein